MKSPTPSRVATSFDLTQALAGVGCEKDLRAALAAGDVAVFEKDQMAMESPSQKRNARAKSESNQPSSPKPPCPR